MKIMYMYNKAHEKIIFSYKKRLKFLKTAYKDLTL